ncbi:hypothetical protein GALL_209320 [mine drainage metagenome]|uniref:Uncharacterized protein n=1 Tax=mine drainage metagenome TaxID=410659 RepID=A0A1J5S5P7_9ZZZZ
MPKLIPCLAAGVLSAAVLGLVPSASAKNDEWKDIQGNSFKGTAVEAVGPFAIFSVSDTVGRRLPMQALPLPDLTRFYEDVKDHPVRAETWAQAKSPLTQELIGHLKFVENKKTEPFDFKTRPEPELVVVFFVSNGLGDSWKLLGDSIAPYNKLQQMAPGYVEGVMYGLRESRWQHYGMATSQGVPWLVTDLDDQPGLDIVNNFVPGDGAYSMVVLTRDGVPVFGAVNPNDDQIKKLWTEIEEFVMLQNPANPYSWRPLAYYRTAEQIANHPTGGVAAELVGNPIRDEVLRRLKIYSFDADMTVTAYGAVSDVDLKENPSISPKIAEAIVAALKMAVFVPAVKNGKAVESSFAYHFRIKP